MKIERISENQIRCTLTGEDLSVRDIRLSELAYGSPKARRLFREMMHEASVEVGFDSEGMPLMVEAIPTSSDSVMLIITRVDDPEELDSRFSRFTKSQPSDNIIDGDILDDGLEDPIGNPEDSADAADSLAEAEDPLSDMQDSDMQNSDIHGGDVQHSDKSAQDISGSPDAAEKDGGESSYGTPDHPDNGPMADNGDSAQDGNLDEEDLEKLFRQLFETIGRMNGSEENVRNSATGRGINAPGAHGRRENSDSDREMRARAEGQPADPSAGAQKTSRGKRAKRIRIRSTQAFAFRSLNDVIDVAHTEAGQYRGKNSLYRGSRGSDYLLVIHVGKSSKTYAATCSILSEYGRPVPFSPARESYLIEHGDAIIRAAALRKLSQI